MVRDLHLFESVGARDDTGDQPGPKCRGSLIPAAADLHQFDLSRFEANLFEYLERDIVARATHPVDDNLFAL